MQKKIRSLFTFNPYTKFYISNQNGGGILQNNEPNIYVSFRFEEQSCYKIVLLQIKRKLEKENLHSNYCCFYRMA